ncbi:hypothetical protein GIB67_034425, partial [Kingdonia uniflora]
KLILAKEDQTAAIISDPIQADHLQTQALKPRHNTTVMARPQMSVIFIFLFMLLAGNDAF